MIENMLDLEKEVEKILKTDEHASKDVLDQRNIKDPKFYEEMDFYEDGSVKSLNWRIYADALREFGVMIYTRDLASGMMYKNETKETIIKLIEQHGLRNVTNEFARQSSIQTKNI